MAQLKDLIVNGPSRFIGDVYATTFTGNLAGNASTATSATNAGTVGGLSIHSGRNNEANKIVRTDGNGYLQVGYINSSSGHEKNASSPTYVGGSNSSDSYLRSYQTSSLSVKYATTSGSCSGNAATATDADTVDGYHAKNLIVSDESFVDLNSIGRPSIWRLTSNNPNLPSHIFDYGNILNIKHITSDTAGQLLGSYSSDALWFRRGTWYSDGTGTLRTNAGKEIAFTDSNVASSTKATQDGNGNTITTTYLPKSSGTVNAICSTAAHLSAKEAAAENFILTTGMHILITFTVANTYNNAMTLNVNGTGAKTLYINDRVTSTSNYTIPVGTYNCWYDGSNWYLDTGNALRVATIKTYNINATSGCCLLYGSTPANVVLQIGVNQPNTGYFYNNYSLYMARKGIAVGGFASTSDMTMKDRIEDLHLNFDDVASMPVFKFRWKDREAHGDNINVGTSAQYGVSKEPLLVDGTEGSYSIQYGVLALACVKTTAEKVKELEDKVLELQEEIKTLKAL